MFSLLKKEIRQFFSGPAAYLALVLFYVANALMLFVLPTGFNIFDSGYAFLDPFFSLAPWLFLFLVPALCMRSFPEEKKTGTLEVLLTRPLSALQIVAAKYGACFFLLVLSLLPTFCYLFTVSSMAQPAGNVDMGAFWGAFLGLVLLGAAFTAVSLFMSSLTENQVVAFILSAGACAVLYRGFDLFGAMSRQGNWALSLSGLGIQSHYSALSRGVVDLRDVFYYLALVALFGSLSVWNIGQKGRKKARGCILTVLAAVAANLVVSFLPVRMDLTADKRYTLLPITKEILRQDKEQPVLVNVYLCGDLPAGFKRLENSVREMLDEFRVYRPSLRYQFVDIYAIEGEQQRQALMQKLSEKGIQPTQLEVKTKEGLTRRLVFPGAELRAGGKSVAANLLGQQLGRGAEEALNNSIENVELQLINAVRALFEESPARVAFLEGQGELTFRQTLSFGQAVSVYYPATRVKLTDDPHCLLRRDSSGEWAPRYAAVVVARPSGRFSQAGKYVLDQYLMHGGRILWLMDPGNGSLDSLQGEAMFNAMPYDLNLEDQFFRYGFRLRNEMLLDRNAAPSPIVTGYMGNQPVMEYIPNYYCPVVEFRPEKLPLPQRILAHGVGPVRLQVAAGIDTIESPVAKVALLKTSAYSYRIRLPHAMSADLMRNEIQLRRFNAPEQVVALLLEGRFPSAFPLVRPELSNADGFHPRKEGLPSAMVVVGDGDIARNDWVSQGQFPLPLGMDRYTMQQYGNGDFLMNTLHYLCGNPQYATLKPRSVRMRLLDKARLVEARAGMTALNFALPLSCVLLAGLGLGWKRRREYA